jgi:hypothetical protein
MRNPRKVTRVMGWLLNRQLRSPSRRGASAMLKVVVCFAIVMFVRSTNARCLDQEACR